MSVRSVRRLFASCLCAGVVLLNGVAVDAANVVINPLAGFDDSTPAAPVGGNTGTTVGEQRLIAFQYAADLWEVRLQSDVDILVDARFSALSCSSFSGTLGAAGPTFVNRDVPGLPLANTWYATAAADSLAGADQVPGSADLDAEFNANMGQPGCLENLQWYYGLDQGASGSEIDFVSVLLHELGHGLGFLSLVSLSTGAKFSGFDDAYMVNLEDHSTGFGWSSMTNGERQTSTTDGTQNSSDLHWTGAITNAVAAANLSSGIGASGHTEMYAPSPVEPGSSVSHFAKTLSPNELMEPSYTSPNHNLDLAISLLADTGWMTVTCGNGSLEPLEECDDGNQTDGDGCDSNCTFTACGNGIVTAGEDCDDGGTENGDCCDSSCNFDAAAALCHGEDSCDLGTCDGAGTCTGLSFVDCSDGNLCTEDTCDLLGACINTARVPGASCVTAQKIQFKVTDRSPSSKDRLQWKWTRGDLVTNASLGDPTTATSYAACVYDHTADVPSLVASLNVSAGAGWATSGSSGFKYKDKLLLADGVSGIKVKAGAAGKTRGLLKAKGENIPLPGPVGVDQYLDADQRLIVDLVTSAGGCMTAEFTPADITLNDAERLKAKAK